MLNRRPGPLQDASRRRCLPLTAKRCAWFSRSISDLATSILAWSGGGGHGILQPKTQQGGLFQKGWTFGRGSIWEAGSGAAPQRDLRYRYVARETRFASEPKGGSSRGTAGPLPIAMPLYYCRSLEFGVCLYVAGLGFGSHGVNVTSFGRPSITSGLLSSQQMGTEKTC